ncbi:MAG: CPBP family intramembrane glutamic endopeptidase [Candidatus Acidiferrales bacterium]|jgi:membrane protease YdiL (CAAX protease family)
MPEQTHDLTTAGWLPTIEFMEGNRRSGRHRNLAAGCYDSRTMIADPEHKPDSVDASSAEEAVEAKSADAEPVETESEPLPQQGLARSIALHLIPGAVATAIYVACLPAVTSAGYPALAALLIASVVGLAPIELGLLFFEGKRKNSRWSLDGILLYRESWPTSRYFTIVPVLFLICIAAIGISVPIDRLWARVAFSWLPAKYVFMGIKQYAGFSRNALLATFVPRFVLGMLVPIVEEMYFRAYLLPRISRLGARAVFLNSGLYALQNFALLYSLPSMFLASLPIVIVTRMTHNYRPGMVTRIVLGLLGGLLGLIGVMHLAR